MKLKERSYKMKAYNHNGIEFDDVVQNPQDWVDNDGCGEMWSQICGECQDKHSDKVVGLLDDYGSGICGVEGCENEDDSVVYIDFPVKVNNKGEIK
jgi:hypothetical protein